MTPGKPPVRLEREQRNSRNKDYDASSGNVRNVASVVVIWSCVIVKCGGGVQATTC